MKVEVLYRDDNLSLMCKDGWYVYAHMTRSDGALVAVLVFRKSEESKSAHSFEILGRYENCLPHEDGFSLTSITGGVDEGLSPEEAAVEELYQEGGYEADAKDLINLGTCRPSKQEDTLCYLYGFEAGDRERRTDSIGDGTIGEEGAYCKWVNGEDAVGCKCPLVSQMLLRLGLKGYLEDARF